MKKILIGLLLLIGITASAQRYVMKDGSVVMHNGVRVHNVTEGGGLKEPYLTIKESYSVQPQGDTATWLSDFYYSIDSAGVYDIFDAAWLLMHNNKTDAFLDVTLSGFNGTEVAGGGALTLNPAFAGVSGDGTAYLNLNFNPTTDATNYTRNAASAGVCVLSTIIQSGEGPMGATVSNIGLDIRSSSGYFIGRINANGAGFFDNTVSGTGLFVLARHGETSTQLWQNYNDDGDTGTTASAGIVNADYSLFAVGSGSVTDNTIIFAFVGGDMSDTNVSDLQNALERLCSASRLNISF